jgi:hypothetical protein
MYSLYYVVYNNMYTTGVPLYIYPIILFHISRIKIKL